MASPADQRLLELLGKWLTSLELHAKYCSLDDASYAQVQPWPEHQRPSRWIIDLAQQKAAILKAQIEERIKTGDATFSDSLELMTFLANLVGSQHIQRYVPLAEPGSERPAAVAPPGPASAASTDSATGTREMPKFAGGVSREPEPVATPQVVRTERRAAETPPATPVPPTLDVAVNARGKASGAKTAGAAKPAAAKPPASAAPPATNRNGPSEAVREQVIADAARLVQWGRKWYELAELIASMADRPHVTDVRRILKDNKAVIDQRAGRT